MRSVPFSVLAASGAAVVALDTSTRTGAVCVFGDGRVLSSLILEEETRHASGLLPGIDRALSEAGVARGDLEGVLVGAGPGSFTGVRIAAATAKGLIAGLGIPLYAVSSLAGAAASVPGDGLRYALFDARSDRVYGACYSWEGATVRDVVEPFAGTIEDVVGRGPLDGHVMVGDGATRHRAALEALGAVVDDAGASRSLAEGLLRHARHVDALAPVGDVSLWQPSYLRPWRAGAA